MKKIYITGIAGMLGINLAYNLNNKYNVVGCDILEINSKSIHSEKVNLLDETSIKMSIKRNTPDVLIHTAAMVNVDACEENVEAAQMLNESVTKKLAKICENEDIQMIYISTDAVFDGKSNKLYDENDITNPINVYAKTKLNGEKSVLSSSKNVVLRTNIYGFNYQNKNSFGEWIINSLNEGKELNMFDDILFSPILVNDLAFIVDKIMEESVIGLYHVCGTGAISKYHFACRLKEIFDIKNGKIIRSNSENFHFKAKRAKNMGMSNEKIKNELGINIRTPQESIIEFKRLYDKGYREIIKRI